MMLASFGCNKAWGHCNMPRFGWVSARNELPAQWDLRVAGWMLCDCRQKPEACGHITLVDWSDIGRLGETVLELWGGNRSQLMLVGVNMSEDRSRLLQYGCGEVVSASEVLDEVVIRAARLHRNCKSMPREIVVGPLLLDLFLRDAKCAGSWLGLHPREFALLWRLAEAGGRRVSRRELLRDVWRLNHDPETNSLEVHVSRLRSKLAITLRDELIVTDGGVYRISGSAFFQHSQGAWLDKRLRQRAVSGIVTDKLVGER
jgi:DNA-binding response OmpR family regulator